jgi:hypothetical protein
MPYKNFFRNIVFLMVLTTPILAIGQSSKSLVQTTISFAKDGSAKVTHQSLKASPDEVSTVKIETAMLFYAYTMNKLDSVGQKALMNQVQSVVTKVATDNGLVRANFLANNPVLQTYKRNPVEQNLQITLSEIKGLGHQIVVTPGSPPAASLSPAVLYLFQDLTNFLPEGGLRLMVLAMGGINKWYREIGQASNPDSIIQAPAYALNLAVDILSKLSGKKI